MERTSIGKNSSADTDWQLGSAQSNKQAETPTVPCQWSLLFDERKLAGKNGYKCVCFFFTEIVQFVNSVGIPRLQSKSGLVIMVLCKHGGCD